MLLKHILWTRSKSWWYWLIQMITLLDNCSSSASLYYVFHVIMCLSLSYTIESDVMLSLFSTKIVRFPCICMCATEADVINTLHPQSPHENSSWVHPQFKSSSDFPWICLNNSLFIFTFYEFVAHTRTRAHAHTNTHT